MVSHNEIQDATLWVATGPMPDEWCAHNDIDPLAVTQFGANAAKTFEGFKIDPSNPDTCAMFAWAFAIGYEVRRMQE